MRNWFAEVAGSTPEGYEVDGMFQCQEDGCWDIEEVATYVESQNLLFWTCEEGHENKVEDFSID